MKLHFRRFLAGGLVLACLAVLPASRAPLAAEIDPGLRRVYQQILGDPANTGLNLRYARMAERLGLLRKALSAYERILINDPGNREARRGSREILEALKPDFTRWTAIFGGEYASNPRLRNGRTANTDGDFTGTGRLLVEDERRIGGRRWRTNGQFFANLHKRFRSLDYGYIGGDTGPRLAARGGWTVRPALGAAYSWLDQKTFLTEVSVKLGIEAPAGGAFQRIDFRFAYDFIGSNFSNERNGVVFEATPQFALNNLAKRGDVLTIRPSFLYNGASGAEPNPALVRGDLFPNRYQQYALRLTYFVPFLDGRVFAGLTFDSSVRLYTVKPFGESARRRDTYLAPGAQLIFPKLLHPKHDLIIKYRFENNVSNDGIQNFQNHTAGFRSVWRF
ncbi:MAG: tetratricopeptide repeat protein [Alphaproteobacteria bacterium]